MAATVRAPARGSASKRARPTVAAPPPAAAANGTGPLHLFTDDGEQEAREPLFYIDGTEYTIPSEPSASIGLGATATLANERDALLASGLDMRMATQTAMGLAQHYILREMIGAEGYKALLAYKRLKASHLRQLMEICSERAYAALEDEQDPNS